MPYKDRFFLKNNILLPRFSKKGNSAKGVYGTKDTGSQIVVRTTSGDVRVTN